MKRSIILLFTMVCLMAGCNQIDFRSEEDDCFVSFNFAGEILLSETPLTKALSTDDLLMIQVKRGGSNFACGIFDRQDNMHLYLKKGREKYNIAFCLVKNGKNLLGDFYSISKNAYFQGPLRMDYVNGYLSGPFKIENTNNSEWMVINDFWYNSVGWYHFYTGETLKDGNRQQMYLPDIGYGQIHLSSTKYPSSDDWFYGEINDYSPNGEFETLNVELKRVGFKLKYELTGVTDGEVTVKVYNDTKTFINNTTSTSTYSSEPQFYAFYEARNAWLYSDEYMENMTLSVSWKRGVGVTEDYGTKTIQIKRNCLNNIKIQMTSADQNAGMNLTVESESSIGADAVTIPVQ